MSCAAFTTPGISCIVAVLFGLLLIHPSIAAINACLKGPKTETSSGWRQRGVCGGMVRRVMPFSLAKSMEAKEVCDSWLSRMSNMGWSFEQRVYFLMCCKYLRKMSSFIHPDLEATPDDPLGTRLRKWFWNLTLGKKSIGGWKFPNALTVYTNGTSSPRSLEVIAPTLLWPLLVTIFLAQCEGPARGGFRSYSEPGLGGPGRVQVSALSFGIAPQHHNQTCLHQKYQSAYSVLVIGRYFCYTAFRTSNSSLFD